MSHVTCMNEAHSERTYTCMCKEFSYDYNIHMYIDIRKQGKLRAGPKFLQEFSVANWQQGIVTRPKFTYSSDLVGFGAQNQFFNATVMGEIDRRNPPPRGFPIYYVP